MTNYAIVPRAALALVLDAAEDGIAQERHEADREGQSKAAFKRKLADQYEAAVAECREGKARPETVEAVAKIVARVGCKNCREKWQNYRDDAVEIIQALGLEVEHE